MSTESPDPIPPTPATTETVVATTKPEPTPEFDRSDVGCMIGLALILILVPVTIYVAAPLAVLGIVAAVVAWALMRLTPQRVHAKLGLWKIFWFWFTVCILIEVAVGLWIKFSDNDAFRNVPIQRM